MTKRHASKGRRDRSLGVTLHGRPTLAKRNSKPGQHGPLGRGKAGVYKTQLVGKQKIKFHYDMGEKQLRRFYREAVRRKGDSGENLIDLLERRLSAVVYRAKLAPSIFSARQLVNHGHVKVNGKVVNIGSALVYDGDVIELSDKAKQLALVLEAVKAPDRDVPSYLQADHEAMKVTFVHAPKLADVPYPFEAEPNTVIELYSR